MGKDKKIKVTESELQFEDIQKTPDSEPESCVKFTETIQMGKKIILEENEE